jgi:hypothetical protein
MEAVGMDANTMATKVGWDMYPIGQSISTEEIPYGLLLGLVLIHWFVVSLSAVSDRRSGTFG